MFLKMGRVNIYSLWVTALKPNREYLSEEKKRPDVIIQRNSNVSFRTIGRNICRITCFFN